MLFEIFVNYFELSDAKNIAAINTVSTLISAVSTLLIAIFTILLVLITFYQSKIQNLIMRPHLKASIFFNPPDCQKVTLYGKDAYYFRIRVSNYGKSKAEQVEVFIEDILEKQLDGSFLSLKNFLPQNLKWSHIDKIFYPAISPGMEKHCDLGFIIDPQHSKEVNAESKITSNIQFKFAVEVPTATMSYMIKSNEYKIKVKLAAANAEPKDFILNMILINKWYDDEGEMLNKGIKIYISN